LYDVKRAGMGVGARVERGHWGEEVGWDPYKVPIGELVIGLGGMGWERNRLRNSGSNVSRRLEVFIGGGGGLLSGSSRSAPPRAEARKMKGRGTSTLIISLQNN